MENDLQGVSPKITPKFFFLSLGTLIALIVSVTSFINLAFATLNFKFPDALNAMYTYGYNSFSFDGARMAIATLIIFFPIFLILMKYWKKASDAGLSKGDMTIKKWMIYLLLFVAALTLAIDLVTLVKYFVSGEITTRFILKVLVVLVVALKVGVYFILELKEKKTLWGFSVGTWAAIKSGALVLILIILSFMVIGTPGQQRVWRLDDKRVADLQGIQWQIINYWQQKEKLPEKIEDLSNPLSGFMMPMDPEVEKGKKYEYKKTGDLTFELCATFSAPMPKGWQEYGGGKYPMFARDVAVSYPYPGGMNESWDHEEGYKCFSRTIDKEVYPPFPDPVEKAMQ
jgi:hypothetical protein